MTKESKPRRTPPSGPGKSRDTGERFSDNRPHTIRGRRQQKNRR